MAVRPVLTRLVPRRRSVRLVASLTVITLLAALAYAAWPRGSSFSRATELLPEDVQRVLWTDWSGARAELGCRDWASCTTPLEDSDLGAASVLASQGNGLTAAFGLRADEVEWELLGQGVSGQVLVVKVASPAAVRSAVAKTGFTAPAHKRADGGVWEGGDDLLATTDVTEPAFQNAAFLDDDGLVLFSDSPSHLADAVAAARGTGLDFPLAATAGEPLAAVGLVGGRVCTELSFTAADPGAQAEAEQIIDDAGGATPLDGYLAALGPDGSWTAAFGYESATQAKRDRDVRAKLAVQDDPGQMQSYPDLFTVDSVDTDGASVVLRGHARDSSYALTQVTQGPVLLASC